MYLLQAPDGRYLGATTKLVGDIKDARVFRNVSDAKKCARVLQGLNLKPRIKE
jgi:hypothetical protein